jgi:peptidoglycan/xylan/chitin deacetylase (PgdA/CDA1 family)
MRKFLVINYHLIDDGSDISSPTDKIFSVKYSEFKKQLHLIRKYNVKVVSLYDLFDGKLAQGFSVAITVDDGNPSDHELVAPLLREYGFSAAFMLPSGKENVLWYKYKKLAQDGFIIGSHGVSHRDLTDLNASEQLLEISDSRKTIEEKINNPVEFFSLPFGKYNKQVERFVKETGYKAMLTTEFMSHNPAKKLFRIGRWSVRRNTSLEQFESLIRNDFISMSLKKTLDIPKKSVSKLMGTRLSNKINGFLSRSD